MPVIIVPRDEWGAVPPTEPGKPLIHPVQDIIIYPETVQKPCKSKKTCIRRMKETQNYFMNIRRLPDIKYSFLVGLDGRIYEGTGWFRQPYEDSVSRYEELNQFISICYIGDYEEWIPPAESEEMVERLLAYGISKKYIHMNYHEEKGNPY